jgi:hypothetical protein
MVYLFYLDLMNLASCVDGLLAREITRWQVSRKLGLAAVLTAIQ